MRPISLSEVVAYCDRRLRTSEFKDYDGAANGLQVENRGTVTRLAAAVDASLATVRLATAAGADLLVVHHGLFWGPAHPWTGKRYELLRALLDANLAVYSSHFPLDAHPKLGNSVQLAAALGLRAREPFLFSRDGYWGVRTTARLDRDELAQRLAHVTGAVPRVIPAGPQTCRQIGIASGGAGGDLKLAAQEGVDTFITGEGPHWTYALAEEMGINVFYGGHYATETFGVKALATELARKFRLAWTFVEHPTGL
jgi:dinuclear metal center YbgI/SA1388 family protein